MGTYFLRWFGGPICSGKDKHITPGRHLNNWTIHPLPEVGEGRQLQLISNKLIFSSVYYVYTVYDIIVV